MSPHRLDPLLRPQSVAVIGASQRKDSMGEWCLKNLKKGGFNGDVFPINPSYSTIGDLRCYGSIADLPTVPDLAIFAVGDHRVETALGEAITAGVPAAVIMSSLNIDNDATPPLKERVARKIRGAGMLVCGANGMGYYNLRDGVWACGFDSAKHSAPGCISLISQSGAGMSGIIDCDERVQVNLAVSTGNELSVTIDQYIDFALELPETRVIGLFLETARNPDGFVAALKKAADRRIPVVALKVGCSKESAQLAVSHSGAMAGADDTYDALFDRYGVHRVADMDEFATALILFANQKPLGPGGLVSLHDSGGEQQLMVDLAADAGVPLVKISYDTQEKLRAVLDPELPAVNPLDGWSRGGDSAGDRMAECLALLAEDESTAIAALVHDRAPGGLIYKSYLHYIKVSAERSETPISLVAARQGTGSDPQVVESTRKGFPVLDGVGPYLRGVRLMMDHRDYRAPGEPQWAIDESVVGRWKARLQGVDPVSENDGHSMLEDFGIEGVARRTASNRDDLMTAATSLRYPLVLKTAAIDIAHKTERGGVVLNIADNEALLCAYDEMASALGTDVLLMEQAGSGVELILGMKTDPQFGPVVMFGFGGVHAEVLKDVVFAIPPFDAEYAREKLDKLAMRPLLDGVRGQPPVAVDAFCQAAEKFSVMVHALRDDLQEVDINPLIVNEESCVAVDALMVPTR